MDSTCSYVTTDQISRCRSPFSSGFLSAESGFKGDSRWTLVFVGLRMALPQSGKLRLHLRLQTPEGINEMNGLLLDIKTQMFFLHCKTVNLMNFRTEQQSGDHKAADVLSVGRF